MKGRRIEDEGEEIEVNLGQALKSIPRISTSSSKAKSVTAKWK